MNLFFQSRRGSALIYGLLVSSVSAIILLGVVSYVTSNLRFSTTVSAREQALHIAESGIFFYRWYLTHQLDGQTIQEVEDFWQNGDPLGVDVPYQSDFEGRGVYSIEVTPPEEGSTILTVESTGWTYNRTDQIRTIRVRMRREAWSEYAILANSNISVEDGAEVFGKAHSNGGLRFDGVAQNIVSSSVSSYDPGSGSQDGVWTSWLGEYNSSMASDVFLGGKLFPAPVKDFNSVIVSFNLMFDKAEELNFDFSPSGRGHQLVFDEEQVDVYKVVQETNGVVTKRQPALLNVDIPDIAVMYVGFNAWVEGVLGAGKRVSVAVNNPSEEHGNIYISNDITYENYTSNTILGLAAVNNIEIVEDSEDDLRIDAALLAQTGRVGREDYGNTKSTLTIYGAVATNQGYGFAYPDATGYQTRNIFYDNNLLYSPPPYFPTSNKYKIDLWEEL